MLGFEDMTMGRHVIEHMRLGSPILVWLDMLNIYSGIIFILSIPNLDATVSFVRFVSQAARPIPSFLVREYGHSLRIDFPFLSIVEFL
jgi:hypothetical protein